MFRYSISTYASPSDEIISLHTPIFTVYSPEKFPGMMRKVFVCSSHAATSELTKHLLSHGIPIRKREYIGNVMGMNEDEELGK
jgi:hypothetical protein